MTKKMLNNLVLRLVFVLRSTGLRWRSGHSARLSHEVAGSILSENFPNVTRTQCFTHAKKVRQHSWSWPKVVGFLRALRFPPTGKLTGWVRINTDGDVKSKIVKIATLG